MHRDTPRISISRRTVLQGGALLALSACGQRPAPDPGVAPAAVPGPDRPNVVVFLADTLRADRLGCYGFDLPVSPAMDAVAASGLRYQTCVAQSSWTKPSMAALWTGLPADVPQAIVSSNEVGRQTVAPQVQVLRPNFPALAQVLQAAGYATAFFLSNPQTQEQYGFRRGFDFYRYERMHDPHDQMTEVIQWLKANTQQPFYLFIHEIDPHGPYLPDAADFEALFGESIAEAVAALDPADRAIIEAFDRWHSTFLDPDPQPRPNMHALSPDGVAHTEKLYLAEIPRVDRQVARLMEALDQEGLSDNTLVVLTSDHGEGFNEHGNLQHGMTLHAEEVLVPLIVHGPGVTGGIETAPVALTDLYPTLARLAGAVTPPNRWHFPLPGINGVQAAPDRTVHTMSNRFQADVSQWHYGMYHGALKVIERHDGMQVFDTAQDPGEHTNLLDDPDRRDRPVVRQLLARYEAERAAIAEETASYGPAEWTTMPLEDVEALEQLGYV